MQFDLDMEGDFAELFLTLRDYLLDTQKMKESLSQHQSAYLFECKTLCMLRGKKEDFILAFNFGYKLCKNYPQLHMTGKLVAHWKLSKPSDFNFDIFKKIIQESRSYALEAKALNALRKR